MKKEDWPAIEDLEKMADKDFKDHFICNPKEIKVKCVFIFKSNCGTCGELLETVNDPGAHTLYHGGKCFTDAGLLVGGVKE